MSDPLNKINSQISYNLAFILRDEFPEHIFSITDVDTTPDLSLARIWISVLNDDAKLIEIMNSQQKTIRYELASKLPIRKMPELKFFLDESDSRYNKIDQLLKNT